MSVARYPFSLTVHLKNGSQLLLDRAIHLHAEWEMCITQVCIPKSQITLFRVSFMKFNYIYNPKHHFRVEKVLKKRTRNKKEEYLVQWSGYNSDFNGWLQSSYIVPISKR